MVSPFILLSLLTSTSPFFLFRHQVHGFSLETQCIAPASSRTPSPMALARASLASAARVTSGRVATRSPATRLHLSSDPNDNQAEIAALEEKLRQLKQDTQNEETSTTTEEPPPSTVATEESLSSDDKLVLDGMEAMEGETEDSLMLSERWKEVDPSQQNQEDGAMGGVVKAGLALGLVLFLAIFSQIPVGEEDLTRYQAIKNSSGRIDLGDLNPGE